MTNELHYAPYGRAVLDTPLVYMILEPFLPALRPFIAGFFRFRWMLSRPMDIRLLPKWMPIGKCHSFGDFKVGDLLMCVPLVILFFAGFSQAFVSPDVVKSGETAAFAIYWAFLTANKTNALTSFLFGIPFERMVPHHLLASVFAVALGFLHTYVAFVYSDGETAVATTSASLAEDGEDSSSSDSGDENDRRLGDVSSIYSLQGSDPNVFKFLWDGTNNMSGSLLLICLSLLLFTSFFRILRKYCFDLWLISHIILAVSVIVTAVIHKVNSILYVAAWWILDLILRYLIMAGCRYPTKAMVRKIEPDICEVRFPKPPGFSFNPGQFVQIAVRKINPFAFHPISISSAPHEPEVTLHIRGLGGWTERLVELSEKEQEVPIFLEGPYGSLGVDIDDPEKYKYILLVCGGIGVTHCQSVGKALQYQLREERRPLKKMRLIWVARSLEMVRGMPPLEDQFSRTAADKIISKEIYYTGRADHEEDPLPLDTRLFNHRPDLDEIFQEMKEETIKAGEVNIAVFGCGPDKLMTALRECCRRHSQSTVACGRSGVQFDLHTETFDF